MVNQVSRLWQGYFDSFDSPLTGGVAGGGVLVIIHAHPTQQAERCEISHLSNGSPDKKGFSVYLHLHANNSFNFNPTFIKPTPFER